MSTMFLGTKRRLNVMMTFYAFITPNQICNQHGKSNNQICCFFGGNYLLLQLRNSRLCRYSYSVTYSCLKTCFLDLRSSSFPHLTFNGLSNIVTFSTKPNHKIKKFIMILTRPNHCRSMNDPLKSGSYYETSFPPTRLKQVAS